MYESGESIVLFARRTTLREGAFLRPVGMAQGVLPLTTRGGVELVLPGGAGLDLVSRGSGGDLTPAPGALTAPRGRDELLDEVRALVSERVRD